MSAWMPARRHEAAGAHGERAEATVAEAKASVEEKPREKGARRGERVREGSVRGEDVCGGSAHGEDACKEDATSRLEPLYGKDGLSRVAASTVVVLGLGGVGSNCVEALARGGVGRLVVVDHDVVQESNINRQAIAFFSTIGRKKTEVVRAMVADINPSAQVETHDRFVFAADVPRMMDELCADADYVVDAIDTVSTKLALAQEAERRGIRLVSSMGAANKLHPECFRFADIYDTANCPLCRVMRKEGRKRGIGHLRVLYSCEQPAGTAAREGAARRERSNLGTASFAPPIMGQMIAGDVLCALAEIGDYAPAAKDGGAL